MGQSKPPRATALIVEDDLMQRDMICLLLEESEVDVIECESAEAAELVLRRAAGSLVLMLTDVQLAGGTIPHGLLGVLFAVAYFRTSTRLTRAPA